MEFDPNSQMLFQRVAVAQEFFCVRCERQKKTRNSAILSLDSGEKFAICNGCYGLLLSKREGYKR